MTNFKVPVWGYWMMGIGFAAFVAMLIAYIHKNRGFRRPVFASPYVLWLIVFTVIPCLLSLIHPTCSISVIWKRRRPGLEILRRPGDIIPSAFRMSGQWSPEPTPHFSMTVS